MTARGFNKIKSIDQRSEIVWEIALHIDDRVIDVQYIVKMYSVYDFFVEVWVNTKSLKIEKVRALEDEVDWQSYLKSIKIEDLY